MKRDLPLPNKILEELVDKAGLQIDRLAPVAFDAALAELIRYHRFLLSVNATRTEEGKPFNYAAVPGESWSAPHTEWIRQYRRLFERAASQIGNDSDFIAKLAHVPLRLLPGRDDPEMSEDVLKAIVDLGVMLIHQLENWVTKRAVVETDTARAPSPRMSLAGSDGKAYANVLPEIVGAWESLLQMAPSVYSWREDPARVDVERWNALRASWPFLWKHLRNTAYMLAVSVWNEDESGAALFRDALVRWPQTLSHHFNENPDFLERRLLFPYLVSLDLPTAQESIQPNLPQYRSPPGADELFNAILGGVHEDVLLLTAALLFFWSVDHKQVSDIGARTASALLRRELAEDDEHGRSGLDKSFGSLVMDVIRLETADQRHTQGTYGAELDRLVEELDNMTERRVVPGRVFTPSTLHGRDGLDVVFLTMLLAKAPENDDALVKRLESLAQNEAALPGGDSSLRDILARIDRFLKMLEASPIVLREGAELLNPDVDLSVAQRRIQSIMSSMVAVIEVQRKNRLQEKPIDHKIIDSLRDAAERALFTSTRGVPFFRGFSTEKVDRLEEAKVFTSRLNTFSKAQFVNPPMQSETSGFNEYFAKFVAQQAGERAWGLFTQRARTTVEVASKIDELLFWNQVTVLARDVGAEPLVIISNGAEARALRNLTRRRQDLPLPFQIERKSSDDRDNFYIATINGIDVYGANFAPGKAWLFSPYHLQTLRYAEIDRDGHVLRVSFQPAEDLKGPLVVEFFQEAKWADWLIYEIDYETSKR